MSNKLPASFNAGAWELRQATPEDLPFYVALHRSEGVMRHIGPVMSEVEATRSFDKWLRAHQRGLGDRLWVVRSKAVSLGILSLLVTRGDAEFGLMLGLTAYPPRLPVDVVGALTDLVFGNTSLPCLKGRHRQGNRAAGRVMALVGSYSRTVINGDVWWEIRKGAWLASKTSRWGAARVEGS